MHCHFLLQGIFPTQGLNPNLLHCRQTVYPLSHQGQKINWVSSELARSSVLWKILKEMGIPDHLTCLLRNLYAGQEATVITGHGTTDWSISRDLLQLMSIKSVMPSNHLVLCCPLCLLPSIFPSIRVYSNELALHSRWPRCWI